MRGGIHIARNGLAYFLERNKYAPKGRGSFWCTSPRPAPRVLRKGNGKLDPRP